MANILAKQLSGKLKKLKPDIGEVYERDVKCQIDKDEDIDEDKDDSTGEEADAVYTCIADMEDKLDLLAVDMEESSDVIAALAEDLMEELQNESESSDMEAAVQET